MIYALSDGVLVEQDAANHPARFAIGSCRWSAGMEAHLFTLRCPHGREVFGLVARGAHRRERREMIQHLHGVHVRDHGCCR